MRLSLIYLFALLSILTTHTVSAFELFGVAINNINRLQFRDAIRNSGAEVVREAGEENLYDVYNVSANFKQSKQLFVAYDKASASFAFAEYHLPYVYFDTMLTRLKMKYGKPKVKYGVFESDTQFVWQVDGIDILLKQEWGKNISRLVYSQQEKLALVQQSFKQAEDAKRLKALELGGSYF